MPSSRRRARAARLFALVVILAALAPTTVRAQQRPDSARARTTADSSRRRESADSGRAQQLPRVTTQARQQRPQRVASPGAEGSGGETTMIPQNASRRLPPELAGDLAGLASMLPDVTVTNGGVSVLGLGPSQNVATLNGMTFAGADFPRDATTRVRVTTSNFDPAIGWFSGARTDVELAPGDLFTTRQSHITVDAPALQYTDPIASRLGQRYTNLNASVGGTGQLVEDRFAYNFGAQGGRKSSDVASLLTATPDLLAHAGVSSDSVARFLQLLQRAQVPLGNGSLSSTTDNVSFIGRIDHAPYDWKTLTASPRTWGLTAYGKWSRSEAQGLAPTLTPSHAGESSQAIGSLFGEYSLYFGRDYLADLRSGVSVTRSATDPYLQLPDGRVLVTSALGDGSGGVSTLQFGGNAGMHGETRAWTWESSAELQLYPPARASHRVKLTLDSRLDGYSQDLMANRSGTFAFNSLADLSASRPASFTRTLSSPTRTGGEWNGFAALSDVWRVRPSFQVIYGARLEGNVFTSAPAYNPAVESTFGARTDHAPNTIHASPRVGFAWNVPGRGGQPSGQVRGGAGEFRSLIDPPLLSSASVSTGLPGGMTRISCVGPAAPIPDWGAYASDPAGIPQQCAAGATQGFVDATPTVQLVDASFTARRSWRGYLGWGSSWHGAPFSIEGTYSLNLDQPGTVDLNFSGAPRFTLPGEGRPVYVSPASIVPATGVVSPLDARRSAAFARVVDGVSDLRSESKQATFILRPRWGFLTGRYFGDVSIAYTLASVRTQQRGFDGSTFGDPSPAEWARGDLDSRHHIVTQWVLRPLTGLSLFFFGHIQSGFPFTPMLSSDVNGDGLPNDRAFVFDPSTTPDPTLAAGMRSLLASATPSVRDCLARQLGRAAARASCTSPWTATFNTALIVSGQQLLRLPRANVTLNLANPLGGLDQLLHGANNLHGWGAPATPDPVLYTVRGFDPATSRFSYAVNPRFGSTRPSINTLRAPFRLTLDVSLDIARPMAAQQLDRWLRPGRGGRGGRDGPKLDAADLARRYARTVPDPYAAVLQQRDSLLLSRDQAAAIQSAQARYRARMDSVWSTLGAWLASLPDSYDAGAAFRRADDAMDDAWELTRLDVQRTLKDVLSPTQLQMLPGLAKQLYDAKGRLHIRIFPRGG